MVKFLFAALLCLASPAFAAISTVEGKVAPTSGGISASSAAATYVNKAASGGDIMAGPLTTNALTPQAGMGITTGRLGVQTKSDTIGSGGINMGVGVCGMQPTASNDLMFWVYNGVDVEAMRIKNSNAYVGIGTASPATKLHMSSGTLTVDGTSPKVIVQGASGVTANAWIQSGATVGKLSISDGDYNLNLINTANVAVNDGLYSGIRFFTGGDESTPKMILTRQGRFSLNGGTRDPATLFHMSSGTLLQDGNVVGIRVTPLDQQTIAGGDTITADNCGGLKRIVSGGAVTTNTTNTFTAPSATTNGCCMDVWNQGANNITLDNNANFVSNGAADVVLGPGDTARVCSGLTQWAQIGATGNN